MDKCARKVVFKASMMNKGLYFLDFLLMKSGIEGAAKGWLVSCISAYLHICMASVESKTTHAIDVMYISRFEICRKSMVDMMILKDVEIEMDSNHDSVVVWARWGMECQFNEN